MKEPPKDLKPNFIYVKIDETEFWDKKSLEEHGITRVYAVYLYDENSRTYLCEMTPSYALHYCDFCFDMAAGSEDSSNTAYDFLLDNPYDSACTYTHCTSIDRIPEDQKDRSLDYGDELKPYSDMDDAEYMDLVNDAICDYSECPTW